MGGSPEARRVDSHLEAVERHPRRTIRLTQASARRERLRTIEDTNIIKPEEPALKDIVPSLVLAIDPPREVQQQLLEDALQERQILYAVHFAFDLEDAEGRPV